MRPRVIPCLLLQQAGLVKTVKFRKGKYLGDPVNIARLFNDKEVDELVILDITATAERRSPNFDLLQQMASECFMPIAYGGGVRTADDAARCFALGVEKVILNTAAIDTPQVVTDIARTAGAQAVIVSMDARRRRFGGYEVYARNATARTGLDPVEHARGVEVLGAGEILITSVDREGTMSGYDLDLIARVSRAVNVPVIAHGGAGSLAHVVDAIRAGASAAAAGSLFVFHGPHRAVLINYFKRSEMDQIAALDAARAS